MHKRIQEHFIFSVAILLFVAAGFLFSTALTSQTLVLDRPDPFLLLSTRVLFYIIGGLQLLLSAFLLMSRTTLINLFLITWGAGMSLLYGFGMAHYQEPDLFVCLGNLVSFIPFPPAVLLRIVSVVLGGIFVGSCALLAWGRLLITQPPTPLKRLAYGWGIGALLFGVF